MATGSRCNYNERYKLKTQPLHWNRGNERNALGGYLERIVIGELKGAGRCGGKLITNWNSNTLETLRPGDYDRYESKISRSWWWWWWWFKGGTSVTSDGFNNVGVIMFILLQLSWPLRIGMAMVMMMTRRNKRVRGRRMEQGNKYVNRIKI